MSVVLITGCSSGFGLATAVAFAQRGDTVVATMRNLDKSGPLEEATKGAGVEIELDRLDVRDAASREAAVGRALQRHGRIDVLVNNAGVATHGPIEEMSEDVIRDMFETNLFGPVEMMRAVLPSMRQRRSGRIVNVTSLLGLVSGVFFGAYSGTKHALDAMSSAADGELGPFGARVISIAPGAFLTAAVANVRGPAAGTAYGDTPGQQYEAWKQYLAAVPDITPVIDAIVHAATVDDPVHRYVVGVPAEATTLADTKTSIEAAWRS